MGDVEPVIPGQRRVALRIAGRRARKIDRHLDMRSLGMRGIEGDRGVVARKRSPESRAGLRAGKAEPALGGVDCPIGNIGGASASAGGDRENQHGERDCTYSFCHLEGFLFAPRARCRPGKMRVKMSSWRKK